MKRGILVTGISGFIGYNVAKCFLEKGYNVVGIIRDNTNLWRMNDIIDSNNLKLINPEKDKLTIKTLKVDTLIHTAWGGVSANDRNDWKIQITNIDYTVEMLLLAKQMGVKRIICLGSQAEYGFFSGKINENFDCNPNSVYGAVKLATLSIFQSFALQNNLEWYWFRLFSIFGKKEEKRWFIPFLIDKLSRNEELNLTLCEQKYDYLYVEDLAKALLKVESVNENYSGIYNLTSNKHIELKSLVHLLFEKKQSKSKVNLGAIPYRDNQVMHMEGNSEKFINTFHPDFMKFEDAIDETIQYFQNADSKNNFN